MSRRMKLNLIFISVLVPGFIIGGFLNHKIWYLREYETEYMDPEQVKQSLNITNETFFLETKPIENMDYLEFKEIKLGNYFADYKIFNETENNIMYIKRNDEKAVSAFSIGIGPTFLDTFTITIDTKNISMDEEEERTRRYNEIDREAIIKKYHINNDLELLQFLANNTNRKANIFTSDKEIEEIYAINHFTLYQISTWNGISYIKGDYEGIIINAEYTKDFIIYKNNKTYSFGFWYMGIFTDELVEDIMNTVIID